MQLKIKACILLALLWCYTLLAQAQNTAIGQWSMHFSYKQGIAVTQGNGKIYCATQGGLFSYNLSDNSFDLMSKLTGLSDVTVNTLNFDPSSNTLIVAYKDANVDIIQNNSIANLPDIKLKSIQGNKSINNIFFTNNYAYLACGFGIVVVDLLRHEIKETYFIGPLGASINVMDVNSDGTLLYAATANGVYTAPLNSINLSDYNSWTLQPGLPSGIFNTLAYFNGKMYVNFSKFLTSSAWGQDIVFRYNGATWDSSAIRNDNFTHLRVSNNTLTIVGDYLLYQYNTSETKIGTYYNYGFGSAWLSDGLLDNNNIAWLADKKYGLVKVYPPSGPGENLIPNGPRTTSVFSMACSKGKLWLAPGSVTANWGANVFNTDGVSVFSDNNWSTIFGPQPAANMDSLHDVVTVVVDPDNPNHAFGGSYLHGVLEFNNGELVKLYNSSNSPLQNQQIIPTYFSVRSGGLAFDDDKNLWVANSETPQMLTVRAPNGTWKAINFSDFINKDRSSTMVAAKVSGQKWIVLPTTNSILVYNNNGGTPTPNPSNTKRITNVAITVNGNNIAPLPASNPIPGSLLKCLAEDQDGAMWIGTDQGIAVIYSPENIFGGSGWEPQQILVQQDGHTQLLLQTEAITAIAVDGANRKWIGTEKSGVFLMSADGTKQIYHFDETNSPLLSNMISCISIDGESGEVYFGSPGGVVSYKSTATEGGDDFKDVYAYPNPVKPDYAGTIAIKGLVKNADVKITDISGTLIYKTKALGGQAIWDGKNFDGERARTGVYLVFCSNDDGSKTFVTKILFIN
ncbi:MAG: T9SS type A sorting domain-containing protein [Bacteroidia bacterium]|nr:T9SS type A sorting domain-containing protein [Bacteroidia bacterium]